MSVKPQKLPETELERPPCVAPPRQRLAELLGSMLAGSLAVAAMSVVML